ncbi:MAG TPA: ribbon-helix-helix domain-containing protein [Hyphomicrobium sp.]|nr:ribbon-helix-helix domain-containing protein [Hyphomicrobium sp.]
MSRPLKRSFAIKGHRTSISLEKPFWDALKEAAAEDGVTLAGLVAEIDANRGTSGLSSGVRIWLLEHYRARARKP